MNETQYGSITAKVEGRNIGSIGRVVSHQGGSGANMLTGSITRDGDGNYNVPIIAGVNYLNNLAKGLAKYASEVTPVMSVGVSGANADYESRLF
ncbi:MAG: hypothetical protein ABIE55_04245 [Candidatus Aenigmatarchaeota archaeon]